jgi:hypothetical protein
VAQGERGHQRGQGGAVVARRREPGESLAIQALGLE